MHFRKKVRLKTREMGASQRHRMKKEEEKREAIPKRRSNRSKGSGLGRSCPNTREKEIVATRSTERAERGGG